MMIMAAEKGVITMMMAAAKGETAIMTRQLIKLQSTNDNNELTMMMSHNDVDGSSN